MSIRIFVAFLVLAAGILPSAVVRAQYYGGGPGDMVDCRSSGYNYQRCPVPWRDARLMRKLSSAECVRGRSWGFDRRGFVWVDHGCAGRFADVAGPGPGPAPWQPGPDWNQRFTVRCESNDGQNHFCQVDVGGNGRVYLQRQESSSPCIEGRTWGWNRAGVWVVQGCRGTFSIDRRW
ncbi:MAG: DUF3011 domain-containing protein [Rudaea sp.]|uniref:DUF3011 domain-containing protein n=1 Tax=Rudaea sp. TaxID=2136325 RepID=UPI0039E669FF